jgi:hypothetical protein
LPSRAAASWPDPLVATAACGDDARTAAECDPQLGLCFWTPGHKPDEALERRDDPDPIAQFGIGLAFAVLIDATIVSDATIVRAVLVPAAWCCSATRNGGRRGLDRILPRMQLEVAEPDMEEELDAPFLATER